MKIGITEGADPTINLKWLDWVKDGKPAIIITKMPRLLLPHLSKDFNIIVHCTITGLGGTGIEPKIDPPYLSVDYYHRICDLLGKERVVLRIDPILNLYDYKDVLLKLKSEAEDRLRISFLDAYTHVRKRFTLHGLDLNQDSFNMPLKAREGIWTMLGKPEVCAEPGLPVVPCVSTIDCKILGVEPETTLGGQRTFCGCLSNKVEICKRPPRCTYGCLYCYWKDSNIV